MLNSYTLYFNYFCKCTYFCFYSSIKLFLSIIIIIIIIIIISIIIIIISNSHRCSLPWKQKHFLLLVLDFKDFSQYGGRSTKCRLLQSSDTLWNSNFLQFERYKFFGITPRAPTTTVIIFVFALQRLVIPKLSLDIFMYLFLFSIAFNVAIARYHTYVYGEEFVVVLLMRSYVRLPVSYLTLGLYCKI